MIKAIPTQYKGYEFKSRIEARWAVFFDALGLKWEYEKEGYVLSDGTGKIQWYDATSWMDKPECTSRIKTYLAGQTTVDLDKFADFLIPTIHQYWQRKHFRDFNYIHVEITPTQLTWIFIILLLYNIAMSVWVVINDKKYF